MSMIHYAAIVVLLCVLTWPPRATSAFQCGNDVCERRGHVACLGSGEDAYCLQCTDKRAKCGTAAQLPGCYLFCHERVRNQTIQKFEVREKQLNDSFLEEKRNYEEDIAQAQFTFKIVVIVLAVFLTACLILVALLLWLKWRKTCQQRQTHCEDGNSIAMGDKQGKEEGRETPDNQEEETCLLILDDQPQHQSPLTTPASSVNNIDVKPATQSQGCQTENQINPSKEAATETDCILPDTGSACTDTHNQTGDRPDRSSPPLNNIPPTEDNDEVVLALDKRVHPGIPSTHPSNREVDEAPERQRYPL